MNKGVITGVSLACLVVLTSYMVEFFDNKNELQKLQIEKEKLSIELLKMQLNQ